MSEPVLPSAADAYKHLSLVPNPDGSLTRLNQPPTVLPCPDPDPNSPALSRDVPLNPTHGTSIRLFRPASATPASKLPLILYFHGGGFIILSAATSFFHQNCSQIAAAIPAIVASVEYRLAPEHRLPAAYEDAMDAIAWARAQAEAEAAAKGATDADPWMSELADFSRVFLMGSSAGGNIVYHAALSAVDLDIRPIKIAGLVVNQGFFGGVRRTESELRFANDPLIPLHVSDLMWALALPEDANRGHVYCDVSATAGDGRIRRLPATVVRGYGEDPLVDKQKEFSKLLEESGVDVRKQFSEEGRHGVELFDPKFMEALLVDLKDFVRCIGHDSKGGTTVSL